MPGSGWVGIAKLYGVNCWGTCKQQLLLVPSLW